MYTDLAQWWPLLSPPQDYADEAAVLGGLLRTGRRPVQRVLELGSGGGHVAHHLGGQAAMTLVDLSPQMLAMSRLINPTCEHVVGDMRTIRLGRHFDAVLVHDAIDYLLTEDEVRALGRTLAEHLAPGGVAVLAPDHIAESFEPGTQCGGSDAPDGRAARYLEWTWDPDPTDTWVHGEYAFVLRDHDGTITTAHESHRFGLFARDRWIDLLGEAGLSTVAVLEQTDDDRTPRTLFVSTTGDDAGQNR